MKIDRIGKAEQAIVVEILKNAISTKVGLTMVTEPDMRKTGNPYFGKVLKVSSIVGHIGGSYERILNNQLERENKARDFEAKPAVWFTYLADNAVVGTNKFKPMERLYFAIKVEDCSGSIYTDLQGNPIDKDLLKPYLTDKPAPATQDGLDKKIVWRTIAVDNIQRMAIAGAVIEA